MYRSGAAFRFQPGIRVTRISFLIVTGIRRNNFLMQNERPGQVDAFRQAARTNRADPLRISPSSISEKVRSRIPSQQKRYDRNEEADEIYRCWARSAEYSDDEKYDRILHLFYDLYKPRILSIAKNYRSLSPVFDDDDLMQTGMLGIFQALLKYDHADHISMKFSTYLEWSIRNVFQRAIGCNDKFVEVYDGNGHFECTMSYQGFVEKKKKLLSGGHTYTVKSRQCYISDEYVEPHRDDALPDDKWGDRD